MRPLLLISILLSFVSFASAQEDSPTGEDDEILAETDAYAGDADDAVSDISHGLIAPGELPGTRDYQSQDISIMKFDEAKWKEIVGNTDFNETPPEPSTFSLPPWTGVLLKIIFYVVIIGIVAGVLYLVVKNIPVDLKIKRRDLAADDMQKADQNIEDVDIQALLEQARTEGDFRAAVRLYYLRLLKRLHELDMIAWKKDKTNRDYLSELFSKDLYFQEMRRLTISYESVWYGEHALNAESFQDLATRFESVYEAINTGGTV